MKEHRDCVNCWWSDNGKKCGFPDDLKVLQVGYKDGLCWAWCPNEKKEKFIYLEKFGYERDRLGVLPSL